MSTDDGKEIARLKALVAELIKRVPPSVTGGSYQTTLDFKDAAKKAKAFVDSGRPTLLKAQEAYSAIKKFYNE